MKNFFKRFITCSVAACIVAATALAGCTVPDSGNPGGGHTDPTKNGYTVTVLYPHDVPVKGNDGPNARAQVTVQLVDADGNDINGASSVVGEDGIANINYKVSGEFFIDVYNVPKGYEYQNKVYSVAGRGDYTISLSPIALDYTATINLPDGTPAAGVTISVKNNGNLIESATTNAEGKASLDNIVSDIYNYVELTDLPEGVSYLPIDFSPNRQDFTVDLVTMKELKLDTVMTEAQLEEWDSIANFYMDEMSVIRFDKTADCYDFVTDTIPEGKKVYYYFTADKDGAYTFVSEGKYYVVEFYGSTIDEVYHTTTSEHTSTNNCEMVELDVKKGEKYYFAYSIPERSSALVDGNADEHELSGTRHFMIAKPVAGTTYHELTAPTAASKKLDYTVKFDTDTAILVLNTPENAIPGQPLPNEGGIFEIRSNTNLYDVKLEYYSYFNAMSGAPDEVIDDISETNKNFSFTIKVPPSFAGNIFYFKIKIKSKLDGGEVEYPAEVPIIIERKGNADENMSIVEYKHATVTNKYSDQSGTFHFLLGSKTSISESDFTIVSKNGGYYVNIDGTEHELVVAISKNICSLPYSYTTIEYMGLGNVGPGGSDSDDEVPSTPSTEKQNNYLTIYADPDKGEDKNNPKYNYTPFIEEYATLCNSDGVYKLNAELKLFLERYYAQHAGDLNYGLGLSSGCWLLSCGYYA